MARLWFFGRTAGWLVAAWGFSLIVAPPVTAAEPSPAARAAYASAAALQNREAWDLAAEEWQSLIDAHPDDPLAAKARFYLGICQLKTGDWQAAEATLTRVVSGDNDAETAAVARWELARGRFRAAQKAGRPDAFTAAATSLEDLLAKHPEHPQADDAAHLLGEALWQAGERDRAITAWNVFIRSRSQSPRLPDVLYAFGVGLSEQGKPREASEVFASFLRQFPQHPLAADVTIWQADAVAKLQRPAEAMKLLEPLAASAGPRQDAALTRLADLELEAGDWPAAASSFSRLAGLIRDPRESARAGLSAGRAFVNAKEPDKARPWFEKLLDTGGAESLEAAHLLAVLELDARQPRQALAAVDRALAKTPRNESPSWQAIVALDRADALWAILDRRDEALKAYEKVVQDHPEHPAAGSALSMLALALLEAGRPAEALLRADAFLKDHATQALPATVRDVGGLRAEALLATGKPAEAARQMQDVLAKNGDWPRREEALLLVARALREAGDTRAALAAAEACVAEFPDGAQADLAWYRVGQLRQESGDLAGAIRGFTAAVKAKPDGSRAAWALLAIGWCEEAAGRLEAAEKAWGELIQQHPDSAAASSALLARGDVHFRQGDHASGLADARRLLEGITRTTTKLDPTAVSEARLLEGLCLLALKQYPAAVSSLQRLLTDQPDFPAADRVLFELGLAASLGGQAAIATGAWERLVRTFPESRFAADAWLELGEQRWEEEDWTKAAEAYRGAITAAPLAESPARLVEQARHRLGWTFVMRKQPAEAAQAFAAQLKDAPQGPLAADAQAMLGESLAASGKPAEAMRAFAAALADPGKLSSPELSAATFIRAAESAASQEDWKQSLEIAGRFLTVAPQSPQAPAARYAVAWARQNLGQLDAALAEYRRLADADRSELAARARLMEGEVLFEQGHHKEAIKAFFKAAYGFGEAEAPKAYHAWQAQATFEAARCFEVLERPDQARKLYAELLDRYPDCQQAAAARQRLEALGGRPAPSGESSR